MTDSAVLPSSNIFIITRHPSSRLKWENSYRDSDGQWFVNYLDTILIAEDEHGPFYKELLKHKAAVEARRAQHKDNPLIFSKYVWVAGYHNCFCDLHPRYFSNEHKIDIRVVPRHAKTYR